MEGRRALVMLALVAALAASNAAAGTAAVERGAPTVDQQQTATQPTGGVVIGGASDQKLAQIVTAGVAGFLSELRLPVACDPMSELVLEIVESEGLGVPTAVVRSSQRFPGSAFSTTGFQALSLSQPVFFPARRRFAFVLDSPGDCGMAIAPLGDSYPRGQGYFDARPNPPGWLCLCEFRDGPYDLPFQTVVQPACLVPNVRGRPVAVAATTLRTNGCRPGPTKRVPSRRIRKGFVVGQSPTAGAELAPGGAVRLVVSSGRPQRRHAQ